MSFRLDAQAFQRQLSVLSTRDAKIAGVWALNDTAADVLSHQQERMDQVFDRPTRFAKNAFMVWRANISTLEAAVIERPSVGKRHFLKVEEFGGQREQNGMERAFGARLNYHGILRSVIPGEHAQLDAFGNWSVGERNKVFSQLKIQRDSSANETVASKKRAKGRARYFVPKHGLAPGVYRRDTPGGLAFRVLKFSDKTPTYTPLLSFYDEAERIYWQKLPEHLSRTIAKMVTKRATGG